MRYGLSPTKLRRKGDMQNPVPIVSSRNIEAVAFRRKPSGCAID
jgi:hypothetical protein